MEKSRDKLLENTEKFIDNYIENMPQAKQQPFKIELVRLCGDYFSHGFDSCASEVMESINQDTPDEDSPNGN